MPIVCCIINIRLQTHKHVHKSTPTNHLLHILVQLTQLLRKRASVLIYTVYLQFWRFVFLLSLFVLDWYSGWFVGLIFEKQQNESVYSKSVTVTERVLLVWCLKDNRMNRLAVKVWQSLRRISQKGSLREKFHKEFSHRKSWKFNRRFSRWFYVTDWLTASCGRNVIISVLNWT